MSSSFQSCRRQVNQTRNFHFSRTQLFLKLSGRWKKLHHGHHHDYDIMIPHHPFKHFARVLTSNTDYHQEDDSGTEVADSEPEGSEPSVSSNWEERVPSVFMRFLALVSASTSSMVRLSRLLSAETETSQEKSNSMLPSPPSSLLKLKQDNRNILHVSHVVLIFTNTFPCPPPVILLAVCCN